jgi:AcrR family transcriptional regulator
VANNVKERALAEQIMAGSVRERRRADTVHELKAAALGQLAAAGPEGLSLRAVARDVGMSVQSIYHYFASRDDLLTALVTDGHNDLADALAAARAGAGDDRGAALWALCQAYRSWALTHPAQFRLIYGSPVIGYTASPGGGTGQAAQRVAQLFAQTIFGQDTAELTAQDMALFVQNWAMLHGLTVLEVTHHLGWTGQPPEVMFDAAVRRLVASAVTYADARTHGRD